MVANLEPNLQQHQQHWLVGRTVRVCDLTSHPELNGRTGTVHGYKERTDRFEVLLYDDNDTPGRGHRQRWLDIRYANLVETMGSE